MIEIPFPDTTETFENSRLVPPALRREPIDLNHVLRLANHLDDEPLTVIQNLRMDDGRLSWTPRYIVARANRSGLFRGRLSWIVEQPDAPVSVTACATLADTGEEIRVSIDADTAIDEGWLEPDTPACQTRELLHWHAAAKLVDLYAPDLLAAIPASLSTGRAFSADGRYEAGSVRERPPFVLLDEQGRPLPRRATSPERLFDQFERLLVRADNPDALLDANAAVLVAAAADMTGGPQRVANLWRAYAGSPEFGSAENLCSAPDPSCIPGTNLA